MRTRRNNPVSLLIVALFFVVLSMVMIYASAADASVIIRDGESVIETIDGVMYVGSDLLLDVNDRFIIMKNVRYPERMIGLAIPITRIVRMYTISNEGANK